MISLRFCGAAGGVTGSGYLVETGRAQVLVDFGIFQDGDNRRERNRSLGPVDPRRLGAVVLTHAHIDHCGRLPLLIANGFTGSLHATPATLDLLEIMLEDMAKIEEEDTRRINRRRRRAGEKPLQPLFTSQQVGQLLQRARPLPLGNLTKVATGVRARAIEAGHIIGSASIELHIEHGDGERCLVFSGDLGPGDAPILRDPEPPTSADLVALESTYGGRKRPDTRQAVAEFKRIIEKAALDGERVIIPAFAVGRTQTVLYYLAEAVREGRLSPDFPIYLDSPMATRATQVVTAHPELHDDKTRQLRDQRQLEADLRGLRIIESVPESIALNDSDHPCIIISASGMCEGGRVVHHLKHNLWRHNAHLMLVGYMAEGTLGRTLLDQPEHVEILGETIAVRADIHRIEGFSAHAGHDELLNWLAPMTESRPRVVLTHGEDDAREALAQAIKERFDLSAECPGIDDVITLE
ncbi:MBL fold metallo-hydrolase [Wenzhouxiangella sp. AB-CW3]|uniref:MBL fold metallo-hydrolase RNA specificity domain-containing protein n=1 Tax=Wenzhouxiangella sp. AB-CW3 TaxID=2771012 RepID=UPI00168BE456|nr:MBL fold metallo-hydrolase [Wenzhouxiangella sp. AB-CW3]QOC23706.1 MBL fold metallo-hydrolase [Wenzhouxiangella sp. AB-CW3]